MSPLPPSHPDDADLAALVTEVEQFVHATGWGAPRQIFALVDTAELLAHEPGLVGTVATSDLGPDSALMPLTPIEQGQLPGDTLADALATITWPAEVAGCVLVLEIGVDNGDKRAEGRLAVGVVRGATSGACALRWRHAPDGPVTHSPDLAPELVEALHATFAP